MKLEPLRNVIIMLREHANHEGPHDGKFVPWRICVATSDNKNKKNGDEKTGELDEDDDYDIANCHPRRHAV